MDKAPERIWVQNDTKDHRAELSEMAVEPVPEVTSCFQEYTRTDISNALIAAAYEAAGKTYTEYRRGYWGRSLQEMDGRVTGAIRALTPDDARAAYDAAIRAAKIEGMREAAYIASNACLVPPDGGSPTPEEVAVCEEAYRRITALIERTEKGGN